MNAAKIHLLAALCILLALFTGGCFRGEAHLSVHADGSCTLKSTLLGMDFIGQSLAKHKDEIMKNDPYARFREIAENGKTGFEIISDFPDMKALAKRGGPLFARRDGKCLGLLEKKTWLYDAYMFDLCPDDAIGEGGQTDPQVHALMQGFLPQIQYDFRLALPVPAESHNADGVERDGQELRWDLSSTLTSGQEKHICVTYRIWNKMHIALTAGLALLFPGLSAAVFFRRQEDAEEEGRRRLLPAALCGGLALAIIAFSAYMVLCPPTLTAQDSISPVLSDAQTAESASQQ